MRSWKYLAVFAIISLIALAWPVHYVFWHTAIPAYLLDWLSLRPFFLPNLSCNHCNEFRFSYIIPNAEACGQDDVFLLIVIAAYHANVDGRRAIRQTWGGVKRYRDRRIVTVFVFGTHNDPNFNEQLHVEDRSFHDVVQADFHDSYKTLSNKTVMALQWTTKYCPQAKFVLKTDEDSFNVPQRYVDFLVDVTDEKFVGGYCFTVRPDRRESSKYFVRYEQYPDSYYPTYCAGPGYIISQKAVGDIISAAENVQFMPMEDVFITGFCREVMGIKYRKIPGMVMGPDDMTKCGLSTWVKNAHNINPDQCLTFWNRVKVSETDPECDSRYMKIGLFLFCFMLAWLKVLAKLRLFKCPLCLSY